MLHGLFHQRQSPNEGIWIDAFCIEQSNEVEKRQAIGSMEVVYKSARTVVAVIEDVTLSGREADLLGEFSQAGYGIGSGSKLSSEVLRALSLMLLKILSARWFTRAWCSHEMQLSTRLIYLVSTERGVIHFTARTLEDLDFCVGPFILEHEELRETIMPLLLHLENNYRNAL